MKKIKVFDTPFGKMCKLLSKENTDLKARLKTAVEQNNRLKKELEFYRSDTMRALYRQNETLESEIEKLARHGAVLGFNEFEGER